MTLYRIFYENADTDEPKRFLGTITANTASQALELAAEWNEIPEHDLVCEIDQPTLQRCPYCNQMHESHLLEMCPLKPKQ